MSSAKKMVKKAANALIDPFGATSSVANKVGEIAGEALGGAVGSDPKAATSASPVAPIPDELETAKRRERELASRYASAGRAGTALSEGSKLG